MKKLSVILASLLIYCGASAQQESYTLSLANNTADILRVNGVNVAPQQHIQQSLDWTNYTFIDDGNQWVATLYQDSVNHNYYLTSPVVAPSAALLLDVSNLGHATLRTDGSQLPPQCQVDAEQFPQIMCLLPVASVQAVTIVVSKPSSKS